MSGYRPGFLGEKRFRITLCALIRNRLHGQIRLVVEIDDRYMTCADFLQCFCGHFDLPAIIGIGEIDHFQQQVRTAHLVQGGAECLDQGVGEVADETDSVREKKRNISRSIDSPDRSVQGGKKHVSFEDLFVFGNLPVSAFGSRTGACGYRPASLRLTGRTGEIPPCVQAGIILCSRFAPSFRAVSEQGVHDGGFSCVGISDQRDPGHACLHAPASLGRPLAADDLQFPAQLRNAVLDPAAVQLQLLLAGSLVGETPAAAALAGQLRPHSDKPGQHVLELGGFDLEPGFPCPGAGGENLQDQPGAVQNLRVQDLFKVAHLHGSESLVEQNNVGVARFDFLFQRGDLSAAHIGGVGDGVRVLQNRRDRVETAGLRQSPELIDGPLVFVGIHAGVAARQNSARHCVDFVVKGAGAAAPGSGTVIGGTFFLC